MRPTILFLTIIFITLTTITDIFAQDHENVELVSKIYNLWTGAYDVSVQDEFAYLATGTAGLQVVNISNPEEPEIIAFLHEAWRGTRILISNETAYLFESRRGMQAIDITNPEEPEIIASLELPVPISDAKISGDHVFIGVPRHYIDDAWEPGCTHMIDISDNENIEIISTFWPEEREEQPVGVCALEVIDDLAYMSDRDGFVPIIDFSDPDNPEQVGSFQAETNIYDMEIQDNFLFVSGRGEGLMIFDITDPTDPEQIAVVETGGITVFTIADDFAYVGGNIDERIVVVDISDIENPTVSGFVDIDRDPERLCFSDDFLFVAEGTAGLRIIDVTDPENPEEVALLNPIGSLQKVHIADDHAYIVDVINGIYVVDISDIANPVEISRFETDSRVIDMAYNDDLLFTLISGRMVVLDISDPENLEQISEYSEVSINGLTVEGQFAHVAANDGFYYILDVSDPENIFIAGRSLDRYSLRDFEVYGNYAYGNLAQREFRIFNVENPENPREVARYSPDVFDLRDVAFMDRFALVAESRVYADGLWRDGAVHILDIADPENPEVVTIYRQPGGGANSISVLNSYAFIIDYNSGVHILDMSDIENPVETGFYDTPGRANDVAVVGETAFVADGVNFGIYDCSEAINFAPVWVEFPDDTIEVFVGDSIEFVLVAEDMDNDELSIEMLGDELPDSAIFIDNGDGSGNFHWQTSEGDTGEYNPLFVVSDNQSTNTLQILLDVMEINSISDRDFQPMEFRLFNPSPNPFNAETTIQFTLPVQTLTRLAVYDISGRLIHIIVNNRLSAGRHRYSFQAADLSDGIYFLELNAGADRAVRKVVLVK